MTNKYRFNSFFLGLFAIVFILMLNHQLFAESVFLKDGSIIEGKILKENDLRIEIQTEKGELENINRKNVIRTLYHTKYKIKKLIKKNDGKEIGAYIVDEDVDKCVCRLTLDSSIEMIISKDDIDSISRYKDPSEIKDNKNNIIEAETKKNETEKTVPEKQDNKTEKEKKVTGKNKERKETENDSDNLHGYYLRGIVPGLGQYYSGYNNKAALFGLSFLGSMSWMVVSSINYSKSRDKYHSLTSSNSDSEFDSAYNKAHKDGIIALVSLITTASIYTLNWIDIIYFSKPQITEMPSFLHQDNLYVNMDVHPDYRGDESAFNSNSLYFDLNFTIRY